MGNQSQGALSNSWRPQDETARYLPGPKQNKNGGVLPSFMHRMSPELHEHHHYMSQHSDASANAKDQREAILPPSTVMMVGEREYLKTE